MASSKSLGHEVEGLCGRAVELGADRASPIEASSVVVDHRVRLKCSVPICDSYGRNRMCPPNVLSVEEFSKALARYHRAIVIQLDMEWGEEDVKRQHPGKGISELREEGAYVDGMTRLMRRMSELLCQLEKEALYKGFRFATALSGGTCRLCDECVGPDPKARCRHPFQARPSMEAMGIDVIATAENAGLKVEFPPKGKAVWTGLLLLD